MNNLTWFGKVVWSVGVGASSTLGVMMAGSNDPVQIFCTALIAALVTAFVPD